MDPRIGLQRLEPGVQAVPVSRGHGRGDVAGGDLGQDGFVLKQVGALGAVLLKHEQQAGSHQHRHGGDQSHHSDAALEGQPSARRAQVQPKGLGARFGWGKVSGVESVQVGVGRH